MTLGVGIQISTSIKYVIQCVLSNGLPFRFIIIHLFISYGVCVCVLIASKVDMVLAGDDEVVVRVAYAADGLPITTTTLLLFQTWYGMVVPDQLVACITFQSISWTTSEDFGVIVLEDLGRLSGTSVQLADLGFQLDHTVNDVARLMTAAALAIEIEEAEVAEAAPALLAIQELDEVQCNVLFCDGADSDGADDSDPELDIFRREEEPMTIVEIAKSARVLVNDAPFEARAVDVIERLSGTGDLVDAGIAQKLEAVTLNCIINEYPHKLLTHKRVSREGQHYV